MYIAPGTWGEKKRVEMKEEKPRDWEVSIEVSTR